MGMDTINNRKITLDADLLLDAEMQTLEGGVASEGCAVDHSENSTIQDLYNSMFFLLMSLFESASFFSYSFPN